MFTRILIATVLSSVLLMGWGYVFWMHLPFAGEVIRELPAAEQFVLLVRKKIPESGTYHYPMPPTSTSEEAINAFAIKHHDGPIMQFHIRKRGLDPMHPAVFSLGFLHYMAASFCLCVLLSMTSRSLTRFWSRYGFVVFAGIFASIWIQPSDVIWFHCPMGYSLLQAGYQSVAWIIAGLPIAALVKSKTG